MPETLANRDDLIALVADLRSRSVSFELRGNALKIRPWPTLTPDEQGIVQANRPALKELIRSEPADAPSMAPEPVTPSLPQCRYCPHACVGPAHHAYEVFHFSDPIEIERRRVEATAIMFRMIPFGASRF